MNKVVRIGTVKEFYRGTIDMPTDVFCRIKFDGRRLSITGVVGPKRNGDAIGGCGQIKMSLDAKEVTPAPAWSTDMVNRFFATWRRWHLNDTRAGSLAQEDWLRENPIAEADYAYPKSHYTVASERLAAAGLNPDADGYKYGHAWKFEEVPAHVIAWLQSLPGTDKEPAWV